MDNDRRQLYLFCGFTKIIKNLKILYLEEKTEGKQSPENNTHGIQ